MKFLCVVNVLKYTETSNFAGGISPKKGYDQNTHLKFSSPILDRVYISILNFMK